ncbi:hypothetical protein RRG08_044610 [Elysia crispata]|uniref:Uncharacterized protein n=1 Tax=Elysia crispata TaxID=231223 RepID=A0AAE0YM09_9GAST|nr:hypothetical protein RRG08_044610 [Elysia crispata]
MLTSRPLGFYSQPPAGEGKEMLILIRHRPWPMTSWLKPSGFVVEISLLSILQHPAVHCLPFQACPSFKQEIRLVFDPEAPEL